MRSLAVLFTVAGAAFAGAGCTAYPPPPSNPAWDTEVRPIMMAHCARCHGAGGNLNVPTEPTGPNAPTIPSVAPNADSFKAIGMYFDVFDCSLTTATDCLLAAGGEASGLYSFATLPADNPLFMPPPPAPPLNDWELGVLANWKNNPVCSNSPDPDPTICPGGNPGAAM
jgi:hypothetical protein